MANYATADERRARELQFVRRIHRMRMLGTVLCALPIASVLEERGDQPESYAAGLRITQPLWRSGVVEAGLRYADEMLTNSPQGADWRPPFRPFDPATYDVNDPATHCYTLMAQTGTNLGQDVQMIQAFQVDPAETTAVVTMSDESTHLEWQTDLEALTPTVVPAGTPDVVIDWSAMTTHGYGGTFVPNQITEVLIGRLSKSVAEIEADFLNLEFIADDIWRANVTSGTSFKLGDLTHEENGSAFPGVTADETWVLGLLCTTCTNPTPWYITTVETCP